jgi:hypothetical protein
VLPPDRLVKCEYRRLSCRSERQDTYGFRKALTAPPRLLHYIWYAYHYQQIINKSLHKLAVRRNSVRKHSSVCCSFPQPFLKSTERPPVFCVIFCVGRNGTVGELKSFIRHHIVAALGSIRSLAQLAQGSSLRG